MVFGSKEKAQYYPPQQPQPAYGHHGPSHGGNPYVAPQYGAPPGQHPNYGPPQGQYMAAPMMQHKQPQVIVHQQERGGSGPGCCGAFWGVCCGLLCCGCCC